MPDLYHQKVTCGFKECGKKFGFWHYHASEQQLKQAKERAVAEYEKQRRAEDGKSSRAKRAARRSGGDAPTEEQRFVAGLSDTCPKCGVDLEEFDEGAQLRHLRSCNDSFAHRANKDRKAKEFESKLKVEEKRKAQQQLAGAAVWSLQGGCADTAIVDFLLLTAQTQ
jgi:hypothetical protein